MKKGVTMSGTQEINAAGRYKTFTFKKGDRVVIKWVDPNLPEPINEYYLATVDMVRKGMVFCTWDQDGTKTKLAPNSPFWVGYGVKKQLKRGFSDKDVHHYVIEWMNKPKLAENEAGAKRTRVSKKMNDANLQDLEELPSTPKVVKLRKQVEKIDEQLNSEEVPENIDVDIAKLRKEINQLEDADLSEETPKEIEKNQEEAIKENNVKKLGKRLAKTRDKFKKLHGSVDELVVGKSYGMVGTAEELGDFYVDPIFKVIAANQKENDTLYAIEYNGGKGKILGSNLPEVTEVI